MPKPDQLSRGKHTLTTYIVNDGSANNMDIFIRGYQAQLAYRSLPDEILQQDAVYKDDTKDGTNTETITFYITTSNDATGNVTRACLRDSDEEPIDTLNFTDGAAKPEEHFITLFNTYYNNMYKWITPLADTIDYTACKDYTNNINYILAGYTHDLTEGVHTYEWIGNKGTT